MDAIELLRHQITSAWDWLDTIVTDITEEQANWQPPGTANSIGTTYAHLVVTADAGFNTQLYGGMPLIATEFKGQVGLSKPFNASGGWDDWSAVQVDWKALRGYGRAVHEDVFRHIKALVSDHLELRVDMTPYGLGVWKGIDIFDLHGIDHPRLHGGEIACLKGMQGLEGYTLDRAARTPRPRRRR